jgi:sec-independent protein translocase protein TatB
MFDVGFWEVGLLFVIGLLVLGPERLPKVATQVGRWVGKARRTATQLRHQLEREIALSEIAENQKRREQTPSPTPTASASKSEADSGEPNVSPDATTDRDDEPPVSP